MLQNKAVRKEERKGGGSERRNWKRKGGVRAGECSWEGEPFRQLIRRCHTVKVTPKHRNNNLQLTLYYAMYSSALSNSGSLHW